MRIDEGHRGRLEELLATPPAELLNHERLGDSSYLPSLLRAIARGDLTAVGALLAAGARLDVRGPLGRTPLMQAYHSRHPALAAHLWRCGADPLASNDQGTRVIDYAMACDDLALIEQFLALGAAFDHQNRSGRNSLHFICQSRDPDLLDWALQRTAFGLDAVDDQGMRPLEYAGSLEIWQRAIIHRPDLPINIPLTGGDHSIHRFARRGAAAIVRSLQQYAVRLPHTAMSPGQADREERQASYRAGIDAFAELASGNTAFFVERARGAVPGKQLYEAALHCQGLARVEIVAELLRSADHTAVTYISADPFDDCKTVLHRMLASLPVGDDADAGWPLYQSVIATLLQLGAKVDAVETLSGDTPLHSVLRASERRRTWLGGDEAALVDLVALLVDAGARLDVENDDG